MAQLAEAQRGRAATIRKFVRGAQLVAQDTARAEEYLFEPVERYFRDTPLMMSGEGANEIQRLVIARHLLNNYPTGDFLYEAGLQEKIFDTLGTGTTNRKVETVERRTPSLLLSPCQ